MIYRYVCIACGFISHVAVEWIGKWYKCPGCQVSVELREFKEERDDKQSEDHKSTTH